MIKIIKYIIIFILILSCTRSSNNNIKSNKNSKDNINNKKEVNSPPPKYGNKIVSK